MVAATLPDAGLKLEEHFNEVVKMSRTGQRGQRKIRDYFLSGYPGCGNRQQSLAFVDSSNLYRVCFNCFCRLITSAFPL
jgi:hypothetical protein